MFDSIADKNPALLIPIISVVSVGMVFIVWIIAHYWKMTKQSEIEASLKKDMLAREFSAAEIERVLQASADCPAEKSRVKEVTSGSEYYLVEKMLAEGHPIEDIERLVRAMKAGQKPNFLDDKRVRS